MDYPCILPFNILMRLAEFYKEKKELRIATLFQWESLIWDGDRDFEMTSQMLLSNFDIRRWHYSPSYDSDEIEKIKKEMECDPSNPAPPLALIDHYTSKGQVLGRYRYLPTTFRAPRYRKIPTII
jgi:hypothetical protein